VWGLLLLLVALGWPRLAIARGEPASGGPGGMHERFLGSGRFLGVVRLPLLAMEVDANEEMQDHFLSARLTMVNAYTGAQREEWSFEPDYDANRKWYDTGATGVFGQDAQFARYCDGVVIVPLYGSVYRYVFRSPAEQHPLRFSNAGDLVDVLSQNQIVVERNGVPWLLTLEPKRIVARRLR
jgi:hypothetical protein